MSQSARLLGQTAHTGPLALQFVSHGSGSGESKGKVLAGLASSRSQTAAFLLCPHMAASEALSPLSLFTRA